MPTDKVIVLDCKAIQVHIDSKPGKDDKVELHGEDIVASDGYHTFDELYEHRIELYIALARECAYREYALDVWRSKLHSDGSSFDGWFVLGIGSTPGMQITYHLPDDRWDDCDFAQEREKAPEFDGHTPADVLKRIREL